MPTEKYQPTTEDVKKAEDMLLPSEGEVTRAREKLSEELEKLGMQDIPAGFHVVSAWDDIIETEVPVFFSGVLNGVRVEARKNKQGETQSLDDAIVKVDEIELPGGESNMVWNRYIGLAHAFYDLRVAESKKEALGRKELESEIVKDRLAKLGIRT